MRHVGPKPNKTNRIKGALMEKVSVKITFKFDPEEYGSEDGVSCLELIEQMIRGIADWPESPKKIEISDPGCPLYEAPYTSELR